MSTGVLLIECLNTLKNASYGSEEDARKSNAQAHRLLELVWLAGCRRETPSQREISKQLVAHAGPLRAHIARLSCQFRMSLEVSILRKRSAIQFLIDDYGLKEFNTCATILDEIIADFRDTLELDEEDKIDSARVPASHTWWFS
ncbi:hypothetical protein ACJJTC_019156 [Scirpophaga incertulas]